MSMKPSDEALAVANRWFEDLGYVRDSWARENLLEPMAVALDAFAASRVDAVLARLADPGMAEAIHVAICPEDGKPVDADWMLCDRAVEAVRAYLEAHTTHSIEEQVKP